jgi:hypothetical protein
MKVIPVNFAKHHRDLLKHTQVLLEKEYLAINAKFDKLITSLRTTVANEYTLDKEATSLMTYWTHLGWRFDTIIQWIESGVSSSSSRQLKFLEEI